MDLSADTDNRVDSHDNPLSATLGQLMLPELDRSHLRNYLPVTFCPGRFLMWNSDKLLILLEVAIADG